MASTAVALTPPAHATISAERVTARRSDAPSRSPMRGTSTQGTNALGHASTEIGPSSVSSRGDRANATPAMIRAHGVPIRNRSARVTTPVNATVSSSAHQSRWTTQPGIASRSPIRKNGPIGHR
jgi:hypothetical protein